MSLLSLLFGRRRLKRQVIGRDPTSPISPSLPSSAIPDAGSLAGLGMSADAPAPPGTLAADMLPGSSRRYGEAFVLPRVKLAKAIVSRAGILLVAILEGIALVILVPLHEKVPYIATYDDSGHLVPDERYTVVKIENVKEAQISASLKRFARYMFTIDSQLKVNFPNTALWVRGAAVNELDGWLQKTDRPYERQAKDTALTREVANVSVTYSQGGRNAFLHIELVERNAGTETRRYRKLLQADTDLASDQVSEENPIGLAITHFSVSDE
jgi:type IV secretory pathway component VirB8